MDLLKAALDLNRRLSKLKFSAPVTHVYNPLEYAWDNYRCYVELYGEGPKEAIFLGMNPGPWGMAQTGVPFGDPSMVKTWLKIEQPVRKPHKEHPSRPVLGTNCTRSEVSGTRLWGAVAQKFGEPQRFFSRFFVANYCPLCFMEESGRNHTPDKLPAAESEPLLAACDEHLRQLIDLLEAKWVIGIGAFAAKRAQKALATSQIKIGQILHPSPASPAANQNWAKKAEDQLGELGLCQDKKKCLSLKKKT